MANPYFKFKQFTIWHDKCAMKVGTDGALLGAWAAPKEARNILDIGTGTGLVALMLAQRCQAFIDAIDIDADACLQAEENVARSPFADRIRVHCCALNDFHPSAPSHYDLIVSNPPYFHQALKCPDPKRNRARHTDTLSLEELFQPLPHSSLRSIGARPSSKPAKWFSLDHADGCLSGCKQFPQASFGRMGIATRSIPITHDPVAGISRPKLYRSIHCIGTGLLFKDVRNFPVKETGHFAKQVLHLIGEGDHFRRQDMQRARDHRDLDSAVSHNRFTIQMHDTG